VRQFGLYPPRAWEGCGGPSPVREDRDGRTAGAPVVPTGAPPGSRVREREPLTASKWEARPKMSPPGVARPRRPPADHRVAGPLVHAPQGAQPSGPNGQTRFLSPPRAGIRPALAARCRSFLHLPRHRRRPDPRARRSTRASERCGPTRSHPEPGRETHQRQMVLPRAGGRGGRCGHL
jgi:hypothetical protein